MIGETKYVVILEVRLIEYEYLPLLWMTKPVWLSFSCFKTLCSDLDKIWNIGHCNIFILLISAVNIEQSRAEVVQLK